MDSLAVRRSLSDLLSSLTTDTEADSSDSAADGVSTTDRDFLREHFNIPLGSAPASTRIVAKTVSSLMATSPVKAPQAAGSAPTNSAGGSPITKILSRPFSLASMLEDAAAIDPNAPVFPTYKSEVDWAAKAASRVPFTTPCSPKRKYRSSKSRRRARKGSSAQQELFSPGQDAARLLAILSEGTPIKVSPPAAARDSGSGDSGDDSDRYRDDDSEKASLLLMLANESDNSGYSSMERRVSSPQSTRHSKSRKRGRSFRPSPVRRYHSDPYSRSVKYKRSRGARALAKVRKGQKVPLNETIPRRESLHWPKDLHATSPRHQVRVSRGSQLVQLTRHRARGLRQTIPLTSKVREMKHRRAMASTTTPIWEEEVTAHGEVLQNDETKELFTALCSLKDEAC